MQVYKSKKKLHIRRAIRVLHCSSYRKPIGLTGDDFGTLTSTRSLQSEKFDARRLIMFCSRIQLGRQFKHQ